MQMGSQMAACSYQVFLSFRGPDTRQTFIKYFAEELRSWGIVAFVDEHEIEDGDRIDKRIMDAIEGSDICIPVFSKDFATSRACLMEVAQMTESNKTILPIFFAVEPYVVRHQLETYERSFAEHERKNRYPGSIQTWRAALARISQIKGPVIKNEISALPEIRKFILKLWKRLSRNGQGVPKSWVGLDEYMPDMMRKLGFSYQDGRVVEEQIKTGRWVFAVWGQPGVGKTNLAWALYKKIGHFFDGCSFLENVRGKFAQNDEVSLQNKLIGELKRVGKCTMVESSYQGTTMMQRLFRTSKVLIVLDDVDDRKQIESLAELTWFGQGSRIIFTTKIRDVYMVNRSEEQDVFYEHEHEVLPMKEQYALELFRNCAFRPDHPRNHCDEMSKEIISAVGYLPFAIDIVGGSLCGENEDKWRQTLDELKEELENKVKTRLEANYELLSDKAKEVFLDIACFFTGVEKTTPCYMWAAHQRGLGAGVDELQKRSFLKLGRQNEFLMHGQLKSLGREIVKRENLDDPGKRSRLWDYEDVQTVLRRKKNTNTVKALRVASNFSKVDGEEFCNLSELKFLELDKVDIEGDAENLLPDLLWLDWRRCPRNSRGCPKKSKLFAFNMGKLVILNLCSSPDKLTLEEWDQLMEKAEKLKVLNLTDCTWIKASLEFPASRHLECLILERCLYLKPNDTISNFENLVSLNMKHCKSVKHLPKALCSMRKLKELLIDGTGIRELQFEEDSLPLLKILSACECKVLCKVTDSIGFLKNLLKLYLRNCDGLKTLPNVFQELVLLQEMDLSHTHIKELPPSVKHCKELQVLKMARTYLKEFPEAIKDLVMLKELDFSFCGSLSGRCDITGLFSLRILRLTGTVVTEVLARDEGQFCLHILELEHGVTKLNQNSQKESSVSEHKRKRDEE